MSVWTLEGLTARQGRETVLEAASLTVTAGEVVGVVGPNGAGKTSLLRAGLGLLPLSAGEARLSGKALARLKPDDRARLVGYLPQDLVLDGDQVRSPVNGESPGVFAHATAFAIIGLAIIAAQLRLPNVFAAASIALGLYFILAIKRGYGRGWIKSVWTGLGAGVLYIIVLSTAVVSLISNQVLQGA